MRSKWFFPAILVIATLFIVACASAVFLWGVYYQHWDGPLVTRIANTLPIPAARMGDRTILYRTYVSDVRSIETYLSSPEAKGQNLTRPMVDDDRKNVIERLMREAALEDLALARKVTVTDAQMKAAFDEFSAGATSTQDLEALLRENFGWTIDDLKTHLIRPALLTRLLAPSYAADHGNDPNALETYLDERVQRPDVVRYVKF